MYIYTYIIYIYIFDMYMNICIFSLWVEIFPGVESYLLAFLVMLLQTEHTRQNKHHNVTVNE